MEYAILNNGVVINVISLNPSNASEFKDAVPLGDYPATMGDTYLDGVFYRDGVSLVRSCDIVRDDPLEIIDILTGEGS